MRRIDPQHPSAARVSVTIDYQERELVAGETLAVALWEVGIRRFRNSVRLKESRAPLCLMGACHECSVMVNSRLVRSCMIAVEAGMTIRTGESE